MSVNTPTRDELEQHGGMSTLAHVAAGALLLAFSAGSLVSISAVAFYRFLDQWNAGTFDLPDAISLAVNLLLVTSADIGMLYAASVLRNLSASGAPHAEQRVHRWAMVGACVLESSTYLYLVWTFDRPSSLFLWSIGIARALAAPLFAAYLSLAKPLPVHARDVAYQASLHSGRGVVRDVARLAADQDAPLHHKVRIFTAAARMSDADRAQFDGIIDAVSTPATSDDTGPQVAALSAPSQGDTEAPTRPPTGPGSPVRTVSRSKRGQSGGKRPRVLRLNAEKRVREAYAADPSRSIRKLARVAQVSESTVSKYLRLIRSEDEGKVAQ